MSGLVLTSLGGASMPTARPDEQLKQVLPAPPVAARAFPQNDEIALFAEVYDNAGSDAAQGRHRDHGDHRRRAG